MKNTNLLLTITLLCFLATSSCKSQINKSNVQIFPISDLSKYPIYPQLTTEKNDSLVWKKEYEYIDDIEMSYIIYTSDDLEVGGYLVKPRKKGNYPCIIYNRGGNPELGILVGAHAATTLGEIASQGYVVIASQYRGAKGAEGQDEFGGKDINDVLNLIDILGYTEGADTTKIGMYGWSRGGMMTYLALTKTNKIDVAVVGGAVSDQFAHIKERPRMETGVLSKLIPNYKSNKELELEKRSAIKWVDKFPKDVPILMLHGNADWRVKSEQSLRLALEFNEYKIPYRLIIYEGGNHGIKEHKTEVNKEIIAWFDKYLKNNHPLPNMEYHGR